MYKFRRPVPCKRRILTSPQYGEWNSLLDYWSRTNPYPPNPNYDPPKDYPGDPMPNEKYENMLEEAVTYIGYSYTWGGKSPPYFDCSGYVGYLYKKYNIMPESVVSYTGTIYDYVKDYQVTYEEAQAGDIIMWGGSSTGTAFEGNAHVGIWIGNDYILDCSGSGVAYRPYTYHPVSRLLGWFRCPDI